jgi:hypothetical protein
VGVAVLKRRGGAGWEGTPQSLFSAAAGVGGEGLAAVICRALGRPSREGGGGGDRASRPAPPRRSGERPRLPLPQVRGVVCPALLLLLPPLPSPPLPSPRLPSPLLASPRLPSPPRAAVPSPAAPSERERHTAPGRRRRARRDAEQVAGGCGRRGRERRGEPSPGRARAAGPGMVAERPPGAAACPRP